MTHEHIPPTVYGISGVARAGKDTFARLFAQCHDNHGYYCRNIAFADALKREIDPTLQSMYGISAWTQSTAEKVIIRPHLVELGRRRREESDGTHWIKAIDPQVKYWLGDGDNVTVTDCRYANEAAWIHSLGGKVIYVERTLPDGTVVGPANVEEALNDPQVRDAADIFVKWDTLPLDRLTQVVHDVWSQLGK